MIGFENTALFSGVLGAATPSSFGFPALTLAACAATARNLTTTQTDRYSAIPRVGYVASAANTTAIGIMHNADMFKTPAPNQSSAHGFDFFIRFGIADATALTNCRMFVGLSGTGATQLTGPANQHLNAIGIGYEPGETDMRIYCNGDVVQTPTIVNFLGTDTNRLTDMIDLSISYRYMEMAGLPLVHSHSLVVSAGRAPGVAGLFAPSYSGITLVGTDLNSNNAPSNKNLRFKAMRQSTVTSAQVALDIALMRATIY